MRTACLVGLLVCAGCSASTPAGPEARPLTPVSTPGSAIGFGALSEHGAPIWSHNEAGYTVKTSGAGWTASTTYGNPRPFIQFMAQAGETAVGQVEITAAGALFAFRSVDLYASVTPIPYRITGVRNGVDVFSSSGTIPNTFGTFKTVESSQPGTAIDSLRIALTNVAPPCCKNPVGLDNLAFGQ